MQIQEHVTLAPYTTLGVGGLARYMAVVESVEDLEAARQFSPPTAAPLLVLGAGSNVLISDDGFQGLVIINKIKGISYREMTGNKVISDVGAGEQLDDLVADTVAKGYWGIENLSHIPGTVGATPVQNVGAYGVEVSNVVVGLQAFHLKTGVVKEFTASECEFQYRDSYFKTEAGRQWVITKVTYELDKHPNPNLTYKDLLPLQSKQTVTQQEIRDSIIAIRERKFPDWTTVGTAGSFFKNPVVETEQVLTLKKHYPDLPTYPAGEGYTKVSLGYILDQVCGLRGYQNGFVGLYEQQALVLVNTGKSAAAVQQFVNKVAAVVKEKTGITIEQEVRSV